MMHPLSDEVHPENNDMPLPDTLVDEVQGAGKTRPIWRVSTPASAAKRIQHPFLTHASVL